MISLIIVCHLSIYTDDRMMIIKLNCKNHEIKQKMKRDKKYPQTKSTQNILSKI